jgi:hypothetical protein
MAIAKILLGVSSTAGARTVTAVAIDDNLNQSPSGVLVTGPRKRINWVHDKAIQQDFVVEFRLTKGDPTTAGWPFTGPEPSDKKLRVPTTGIQKQLKNDKNADWHYVVTIDSLTLDPMIIIRSRSLALDSAIAFGAGLIVGVGGTLLLQ